jgi:PEP-CTERM motif/von Willebrand factor type A domain
MRFIGTLLAFVLVSMMCSSVVQAQLVDVMWVLDRSGSMSGDAAQVVANIGTFNTHLQNAGYDMNYGFMTYLTDPRLETDITDLATFTTDLDNFSSWAGGVQNGFKASDGALAGGEADVGVNWRAGAIKTIVLVTDEDADDAGIYGFGYDYPGGNIAGQQAHLNNYMDSNGALLNVIHDRRNPNSEYYTDYDGLGINQFDLYAFRANPEDFIDDFAQAKIEEIQGVIPEPTTFVLLGLGLGLVGLQFRRKILK